MPPLSFDKFFSADHLFNGEPGPPSIIYAVIGVIYLLVLGAGIFFYVTRKQRFPEHRLNARIAERASIVAIVLGALGVILVILRYQQVPILSARILIYLLILVSVGLLAYFIYYLLRVYPADVAKYEAEELRRRYMPRPKGKPSPMPTRIVRPRKKGKKRR